MAIFKDIPRFDGSGITEYYRVNDGKIVRLSSDYDFLDDKPMINGVVLEGDLSTADLNIPVGDITQLKTEIKDNIVNAINELQTEANDFEKFITDKVNAIISFTIVWVAELPAIKDAKPNTVYLVPKKSMIEDDNYCEEYIFTDGHWEKIGDTKVDLSGYYTKEEVNSITQALEGQVNIILQDYATKAELEERASQLEAQVDTILEDYATKEELNTEVDELTTQLETLEQNVADNYVTNELYQSFSFFATITAPADGSIYCVNDGEMKAQKFYQIPAGVKVGYRNASGNPVAFSGSLNNSEYINQFRAVSFQSLDLNYKYTNYGVFLTVDGSPSWVYGPGFVSSSTSGSTLAGVGTFPEPRGYLRYGTGKASLPTSYSSFDTSYLTGNAGYRINESLTSLSNKIGTLTNLTTEAKDNLVNALNELQSEVNAVGTPTLFTGDYFSIDTQPAGNYFFSGNTTGYGWSGWVGVSTGMLGSYAEMVVVDDDTRFARIFNTRNEQTIIGKINGQYYNFSGEYLTGEEQHFNGQKIFHTIPYVGSQYSPLDPTENAHATNKKYVDTAIANAIKDIHSFEIQVVNQLPTANISTHTLYLVPSEKTEDNNTKDEYIYVNNGWEMVGTTKVDLSNYYTKPEVDEKVDNLYLRCNREEYEAMSQEDRDSFLVAIVDDIAVLTEQDLTNITKVLGGNASKDMEIDISTNEAIAITDKIIGGTE